MNAVQRAEAKWANDNESGLGKAKNAVGNFINTMDAHSYLFSVAPNGDKYTSLITGVVTSVVKGPFLLILSLPHSKRCSDISRLMLSG